MGGTSMLSLRMSSNKVFSANYFASLLKVHFQRRATRSSTGMKAHVEERASICRCQACTFSKYKQDE